MQAEGGQDHIVHRFGRERSPVVVIDDFCEAVDELRRRGTDAEFGDGGAFYPGLRAPVSPDFLTPRHGLVTRIMTEIFGFKRRVKLQTVAFSLVTKGEAELAPLQCIPHYDFAGDELVAGMLYLLDQPSGGTAFYRHRRTGFETISPRRKQEYHRAMELDQEEFGTPPQQYQYGSSDRYEMIGEVEARPGRLALYPGRLLHSGVIPRPEKLSADPRLGRLTINLFFMGR